MAPSAANVESRVAILNELIREIADVEDDDTDFSNSVDLFDYGYLDSFGIVELITMVQEKFKVDLTDTNFCGGNIRTVEAIASHICKQLT